ncbi:MAG: tetratricopeptide repeat protein, partial [Planctomycetota bacterium]|nr:tetratricopeptide repeat protein [Planctomycetota bacterium]
LEWLKRAEVGDEESLFEGLDPKDIGAGYTLKVAQSLALHFGELWELETAVLRVAAVCHPDGIPVALFCKVLGKDEEEVEEALRGLASRSIVRYDPTVSVHRLMQSVVRGRMKAAMREVVGKVVAVLAEVFEGAIDPVNMVRQDPYAAHAEAVVGHAEKMGGVERAGELGNQVGVYLWNRARYEAALGVLRRAERIDRAAFGDNHPNVASLVNNIGKMLQEKGDLEGAMKCYREAERIDRAASGDNHPDVARFVNNIGSVLHEKGDLEGAMKCFREAERIDRAAFGDNHPEVATDVNNIGEVLRAKGDLEGAMKCYREAERIDRAALGDNHPNVAIFVNNIGVVLREKGDLEGAMKCLREAERIDRATFGDNHPEVATDVNNIGEVLFLKGDREGARAALVEAFRIWIGTVGGRARLTIDSANSLKKLGLDPIAMARQIAGEAAAEELREAMEGGPGGTDQR